MTRTRWRYFGPVEFAVFNVVCVAGMVGVIVTADEPLAQLIIGGILVSWLWFFALRCTLAVRRVRSQATAKAPDL